MAQKTWLGTSATWNTAANWSPANQPTAGDDVRIPAGSGSIDGYDDSTTALGDVIVEDGFTNTIGSTGTDLTIDPDRFEFAGTGASYIDLGSAAIPVEIRKTGTAGAGKSSLYLKGTGITTLSVEDGLVGVARVHQSTSTVGTISCIGSGSKVVAGEGCAVTTVNVYDGECTLRQGSTTTTVNVYGGTFRSEEVGVITNCNVYGGTAVLNARGTIAALTCYGGETDMLQSGSTRTVTALKVNPGATFRYDPDVVGIGSLTAPDEPVSLSGNQP